MCRAPVLGVLALSLLGSPAALILHLELSNQDQSSGWGTVRDSGLCFLGAAVGFPEMG